VAFHFIVVEILPSQHYVVFALWETTVVLSLVFVVLMLLRYVSVEVGRRPVYGTKTKEVSTGT